MHRGAAGAAGAAAAAAAFKAADHLVLDAMHDGHRGGDERDEVNVRERVDADCSLDLEEHRKGWYL